MNKQEVLDITTGKLYQFDFDNTVAYFKYDFNDNPHDPENEIILPYSYRIVKFTQTTGFAIIISHWLQRGMILGCPDCALTEVNTVYIHEEPFEETNRNLETLQDCYNARCGMCEDAYNSLNHFYNVLETTELPIKVYQYFYDQLLANDLLKLTLNVYD